LQGVRVLIVDDRPINCRIPDLLMKKWGLIPTVMSDSAAAFEHVQEKSRAWTGYDLAILDFNLARLKGLQLARAIVRAVDSPPGSVLLTSVGRRGDAKSAREMGVSAYLTKPIRESQLHHCLSWYWTSTVTPSQGGVADKAGSRDAAHPR